MNSEQPQSQSQDNLAAKLSQLESRKLPTRTELISSAKKLAQSDDRDSKEEAVRIWQRVAQSSVLGDDIYADAINALSELHSELGEHDKALCIIEDSLEYTHSDKRIRRTQCTLLHELGHLDEAERVSKECNLVELQDKVDDSIAINEQRDREDALKALKDTSDRFLGRFGLSTDMLNVRQGEDGKYSFNMDK
ncbi:hypothetical protein E3P99_00731 [Wallemia hederae]|uniref:Tetratricopeptide repeat protein n=1 Tax=Wallemia hederae TaxID=1540922 RepID=A0A4T0FYJ5_9BASI|nr:hypothetical protein E3P99_00731 [Wallemia hederae]